VQFVFAKSAYKHGIADQAMTHALRNPVRILELDDLIMVVGADDSGRLLEIGVVRNEETTTIVHAMPARQKFLR